MCDNIKQKRDVNVKKTSYCFNFCDIIYSFVINKSTKLTGSTKLTELTKLTESIESLVNKNENDKRLIIEKELCYLALKEDNKIFDIVRNEIEEEIFKQCIIDDAITKNRLLLVTNRNNYLKEIDIENIRIKIEERLIYQSYNDDQCTLNEIKQNIMNITKKLIYEARTCDLFTDNELDSYIDCLNKDEIFINVTCKICMTNKIEQCLFPCGHFGMCDECITKLKNKQHNFPCPFCREKVFSTNTITIV